MSDALILGEAFRVLVTLLGFVAMWALWKNKADRSVRWTKKLRDIWWTQFLLIFIVTTANIELFRRHVAPTISLFGMAGVLIWSIKASMNKDTYTIDEPGHNDL